MEQHPTTQRDRLTQKFVILTVGAWVCLGVEAFLFSVQSRIQIWGLGHFSYTALDIASTFDKYRGVISSVISLAIILFSLFYKEDLVVHKNMKILVVLSVCLIALSLVLSFLF